MQPDGPSPSTDPARSPGEAGQPGVTPDRTNHVLADLGFSVWRDGDELRGSAAIGPEMHVPGTRTLRLSVLAIWVDLLAGLLAVDAMRPRVPVTLQLDVNLVRPPTDLAAVNASARTVKAGREVVVSSVELRDENDEVIGVGNGLFRAASDPALQLPSDGIDLVEVAGRSRGVLDVPFAERAGCERTGMASATIGLTPEHTNAAQTLNGGLIALLVEEAALSAGPSGTLSTIALRYLRPVRVGPATATAEAHGDLAEVVVLDQGRDAALAVMATTRSFGDPER